MPEVICAFCNCGSKEREIMVIVGGRVICDICVKEAKKICDEEVHEAKEKKTYKVARLETSNTVNSVLMAYDIKEKSEGKGGHNVSV